MLQQAAEWLMNPEAMFAPGPVAQMLGTLAIFWVVLQVLPNLWAGGKLFDRKFAFASTAIATVIAFIIFVVPHLTGSLLIGVVVVVGLATLTVLAWIKWH